VTVGNLKVTVAAPAQPHSLIGFHASLLCCFSDGGEFGLSRTARPNMEPRMNDEGEFICDMDNKTFKTREEYDRHLSSAHKSGGSSKGW